jgi:two-component system, OmpR family, response regulator
MDKFRVLVVDDEDDFRDALKGRLQMRRFSVKGARDGEKALELLRNQDFDVVILDIMMPKMSGLECLKEIKKTKPLVEVILLTAHDSVQAGVEGMQLGAFDHVMKPVPMEELLEKMELAYERKVTRETHGS